MTLATFITAFLAVVVSTQLVTAQEVCDALENGPYLGTKPMLLFEIDEATDADLKASEAAGDLKYHTELRLYGHVGVDFNVEVMSLGVLDPLNYLTPVHIEGRNYLMLNQPLDREGFTQSTDDDIDFVNFVLRCVPVNSSEAEQEYDASLIVNDVNDNDPIVEDLAPVTIRENFPEHTVITVVSASDADLNLDKQLEFSLGNNHGFFAIKNDTGEITLTSPLNYESLGENKSFELPIIVTDGGPGAFRSATAVLTVTIIDADDQGPVFVYDGCLQHHARCAWPTYRAGSSLRKDEKIPFTAQEYTSFSQIDIRARDQDSGVDGQIVFKIVSIYPPEYDGQFIVETSQGQGHGDYVATVKAVRDMEVSNTLQIHLVAEEQNDPKRTAVALLQFDVADFEFSNTQDSSGLSDNKDNSNEDYSAKETGLIVATSVLAAILLCSLFALIYSCRKTKDTKQQADLQMEAHTNNGYRL